MTNKQTQQPPEFQEPVQEQEPAVVASTEEATAEPMEQEVAQSLEEELLKWKETAMRTAAEYDNYRKRMVKEQQDFTRYANVRLLEELLPVIDNFEMGLQAASADASSMIYIGMNMVKKQLDEFLTNMGVEAVPTEVGQNFDHNLQEAIRREASDQPEGTILQVLRKGYMLKDRLLRPSNVVVAHNEEESPQA